MPFGKFSQSIGYENPQKKEIYGISIENTITRNQETCKNRNLKNKERFCLFFSSIRELKFANFVIQLLST